MERVLSQRSRTGSEKSEKRKSGFFGFGRKDKDKDKDKDKERKEEERRESLQPVREAPVNILHRINVDFPTLCLEAWTRPCTALIMAIFPTRLIADE